MSFDAVSWGRKEHLNRLANVLFRSRPRITYHMSSLDRSDNNDLVTQILRPHVCQSVERARSSNLFEKPICASVDCIGKLVIGYLSEAISRLFRDRNGGVWSGVMIASSLINKMRQQPAPIDRLPGVSHDCRSVVWGKEYRHQKVNVQETW